MLDAFRSYVYYGTVSGSKDAGLSVSPNTAIKSGQNNQVTYSGTAGGFGVSLLNGSVKKIRSGVRGEYGGGFFCVADLAGVANISAGNETSLLDKLLKLGRTVKNSKVTSLSNVRGLNSVGGFVGYSGKSGVVKADKIDVIGDNTGQLLGGALGVMDIFGSHIDDCAVTVSVDGFTVLCTN